MSTFAFTIELNDSEIKTVEVALKILLDQCESRINNDDLAPYFAYRINTKSILQRLYENVDCLENRCGILFITFTYKIILLSLIVVPVKSLKMKSSITIALLSLSPFFLFSQTIPKEANIIIVKPVGFTELCNALLDSGYTIDKKDNELQTARTEPRHYPKLWNATYIVNIRVKDSIAYISGTVTAPPEGGLFKNEPLFYQTKGNGKIAPKSLFTVPFMLLNNLALAFNREVSYTTR